MASIEQKTASLVAEEYKRRTHARNPRNVDPLLGCAAGLANICDRVNTARVIDLATRYLTEYGPDSQLQQALWYFIRRDGRMLAEYAAKLADLDSVVYRPLAELISESLKHFPEVRQ